VVDASYVRACDLPESSYTLVIRNPACHVTPQTMTIVPLKDVVICLQNACLYDLCITLYCNQRCAELSVFQMFRSLQRFDVEQFGFDVRRCPGTGEA
jgi:hypothetical protein